MACVAALVWAEMAVHRPRWSCIGRDGRASAELVAPLQITLGAWHGLLRRACGPRWSSIGRADCFATVCCTLRQIGNCSACTPATSPRVAVP
jgi:hypothetical protein